MSKSVNIGLIGTGFMGKAHSECYKEIPDVGLEIVASRTGENAKNFARSFGYKHWTSNWRDVLEGDKVDLVDIVVPNHLHEEIAVAAAKAGKAFIIEKPLARNLEEADKILEAVSRNKVRAIYAECLRYSPVFVKAKEIIDQGGIGKPFMIRVTELVSAPFPTEWRWDGKIQGGGALIDCGIHGLYVIEWLMGTKIKKVYAETGVLRYKDLCINGCEDNAIVVYSFEDGTMGELTASYAITGGMDSRTEIFGPQGRIYIDVGRGSQMVAYSKIGYGPTVEEESKERPHAASTQGWSFPLVDEWRVHGHAQQAIHSIECIRKGVKPKSTLEEGRRALEVVMASYRSAKLGEPVSLPL